MRRKPRARSRVVYKSDSFLVRDARERVTDVIYFVLCRPDGSRLDRFEYPDEAIFVARFCEKNHGGSYEAIARHSAKAALERAISKAVKRGLADLTGEAVN